MREIGIIGSFVFFAGLLWFLPDLAAQSSRGLNLRPQTTIVPTNQGKGHALRKNPPVRPFAYFVLPEMTNAQHRAFSATTPSAISWVRAGTGVNRTFGDYYVDPWLWINNQGLSPTNALWRNPNNPTNWISTRTIRIIIRAPYTPPR
jgi:hypothetical protein|tara:strand:- start:717 stop:1157 length:441 start_codon:yes stop_codon:yes gene_type:complete